MCTVISFTKPITELGNFFANGEEVYKNIDLSDCTEFWPKGTNSECLIYAGQRIKYSCCYSWAYGVNVITSVWGESGCVFDKPINYDELEQKYGKKSKKK